MNINASSPVIKSINCSSSPIRLNSNNMDEAYDAIKKIIKQSNSLSRIKKTRILSQMAKHKDDLLQSPTECIKILEAVKEEEKRLSTKKADAVTKGTSGSKKKALAQGIGTLAIIGMELFKKELGKGYPSIILSPPGVSTPVPIIPPLNHSLLNTSMYGPGGVFGINQPEPIGFDGNGNYLPYRHLNPSSYAYKQPTILDHNLNFQHSMDTSQPSNLSKMGVATLSVIQSIIQNACSKEEDPSKKAEAREKILKKSSQVQENCDDLIKALHNNEFISQDTVIKAEYDNVAQNIAINNLDDDDNETLFTGCKDKEDLTNKIYELLEDQTAENQNIIDNFNQKFDKFKNSKVFENLDYDDDKKKEIFIKFIVDDLVQKKAAGLVCNFGNQEANDSFNNNISSRKNLLDIFNDKIEENLYNADQPLKLDNKDASAYFMDKASENDLKIKKIIDEDSELKDALEHAFGGDNLYDKINENLESANYIDTTKDLIEIISKIDDEVKSPASQISRSGKRKLRNLVTELVNNLATHRLAMDNLQDYKLINISRFFLIK